MKPQLCFVVVVNGERECDHKWRDYGCGEVCRDCGTPRGEDIWDGIDVLGVYRTEYEANNAIEAARRYQDVRFLITPSVLR